MNFQLTMDVEGLDPVFQLLDMAKKWGSVVNGAKLQGKKREDGKNTNAQLLHWQGAKGRDVVTPNEQDVAQISASFVNTFHQRMVKRIKSITAYNKKIEKYNAQVQKDIAGGEASVIKRLLEGKINKMPKPLPENDQWANATMGECLRKSMKTWMAQASERLVNQTQSNGMPLEPLSEKYKKIKIGKFGFGEPILKATGQITDALNPTGPGGRNIRLIREGGAGAQSQVDKWADEALDFGIKWLKK